MDKAVGRKGIMSDTGIVFRGYHELLTLFRKVNRSTIILKKHYFDLQETDQSKKRELSEAKKFLTRLLKHILAEIGDESTSTEWEVDHSQAIASFAGNLREKYIDDEDNANNEEHATNVNVRERQRPVRRGPARNPVKDQIFLEVPPLFILHLEQRHQEALHYYIQNLRELQEALAGTKKLTDKLISQLDELCDELDTELTSTSRKLQRR